MTFDTVRWVVSKSPIRVVAAWIVVGLLVGLLAPDLTKLAAEGQADLSPETAESRRGADLLKEGWPEDWFESMAVLVLEREGGLKAEDLAYASKIADRFAQTDRPKDVLRVLGPASIPEVAARLMSHDRSMELIVVHFGKSFVSPSADEAVAWLQTEEKKIKAPEKLRLAWTGEAVIGRDYMADVQTSLDRASIVTVFLLLTVLLAVYRSLWLALVPLATIGVSLVVSRGLLAWLTLAGWEISPLVELFLIVILFGCGTDFCLFLSWRFGEHWNASNPAGAMRATLRKTVRPLVTSAGTVIIGLCLMGTTRFKLFSSTGPSVALGLAVTLIASLSLAPALLVLLARYRPKSFAGLTAPSSGFWDDIGHRVLARPILTWVITVGLMLPIAYLGIRHEPLQDLFAELPGSTDSVQVLRRVSEKFGPGFVAPLTVVVKADRSLRDSQGLALIDDVSRLLEHQRSLAEVRSATQPLGSPKPLERARLASRLGEVSDGFTKISGGAKMLQDGLNEGAAKLRAALWLQAWTGLPLAGGGGKPNPAPPHETLNNGLRQASTALLGINPAILPQSKPSPAPAVKPKDEPAAAEDPRSLLLRELTRAADGAGQIADGAKRAQVEVAEILADPVGRHALDRLLLTPANIRDNPELLRSFAAYLSETKDGKHLARIDLTPRSRMLSNEALDEVETLRRRLHDYLGEIDAVDGIVATALISGTNADAADTRELTRGDQVRSWIIVPLGVFILLALSLRDFWGCVNLVATMCLTYAFALGVTWLVFVVGLGSEGIDWKVPYFLFVLLIAVGVDYNVFLMARLQEESLALGLKSGINRAIAQTGGLITSAAAITAFSFASLMSSPLGSLRQLGFALVVGILVDASLVRPLLVPIGQWLIHRRSEKKREVLSLNTIQAPLARVPD